MSIMMTTAEAAEQASSGTDWGTVVVACLGFVGIIVTQILTRLRDKAQQEHQTAAALRQKRVEVYSELIDAANNLMLKIPEVLIEGSGGGSLTAEERSPMNAASSKAHLLASPPVQTKVTDLVDAVYAYADTLTPQAWEAFDNAIDAFVDAAQAEDDHGNILGLPAKRRRKKKQQSGG